MQYNKLIPELSVSDFNKSLDFYTKILNFKIEYERELFAFLSLEGSQLMIDGKNDSEDSAWFTGELEYPRGRGVHFQIEVKSILPFLESLEQNNYPVKEPPKEYWFKKDNELVGVKGFLVMDPDGYLLMFNEDIGRKPA
ncbi:VOC family protein [Candidatus Woesearchaeota archaeon]|nr:VOC family protein [Candidatus Woesearchaeota archaeon]MBW3016227.1 VOC family protein [Candidatus Woesearchaeota archaeon]